jgi:ankyrin repeat protein
LVDAVRKADGGKVSELLESRPEGLINARGDDGETALTVAIKNRSEDFTGFLLNKGADPNLAGKGGETPLVAAARAGFDTAIEWLLATGAKVDGANRQGETALIVAVQMHEPMIVRRLLAAGANPDKSDNVQGFSARDYATRDPRARDILKIITDKKPAP